MWLGRLGGIGATAAAFGLYALVDRPWHVLGWVGLVPWLAVLDRARSRAEAARLGVLMSMGFTLAVFWWFGAAVADYAAVPRAVGWGVLALGAPLFQPQLVVAAVARHEVRRQGRVAAAIVGATAWVAAEWAVPKLFGDTLGHGQHPARLVRQVADVTGVGGITLVLVLANESLLGAMVAWRAGMRRRAAAALAAVGLLAAMPCGYGALRLRALAQAPAAPPVRIGVVQADIGNYDRLKALAGTFDATRMILDTHFALSREVLASGAVDVLLWSETAYPTTFGAPKSAAGAAFDREIAAFAGGAGVPLVFGAYDADGGREYNAAVFLEPEEAGGTSFDSYRKAALFPLIEYTPAWLDHPAVRRALPWLGAWAPGAPGVVIRLRLGDGRRIVAAPLVCYDAVDPAIARRASRAGAEILVALSNDGWFAEGRGPRLHLVVSAFRSIETRRPQVRATNTGVSAVIDATGELVATIGTHERRTVVADLVPATIGPTLTVAWGDWLGMVAAVVALGGWVRTWRRPARAC